ncbi:Endonuclease/exonuclease/phosphatase [Gossypium australe]|uniref:Endonuclease/exonuclease/phosphatase n=1 Tax=Gossypium australe TaxID=47621 RepID=A0A5B6WR67_9ROSI|nr:Endonuclease/exonuclease/phosphatase [Gossypium australe]
MDLENDYYLVKFQDEEDYSTALICGTWIIFRQYLMVISGAIGLIYKIDHNTDSSIGGRFARLVVCVLTWGNL